MSINRVQQGSPNKDRQVLQRTKRPPPELLGYIGLANLVPPKPELPDYGKLNEEVLASVSSQGTILGSDAWHAR
jgi:hypothetical protein